ncbi:toll/interleukin-1 receptor domain-containing protein [Actinokineospora sp.]|uniref:toll/interleukin-1 receptor domain-containing protein n=1 Tax=Actinokineospora sp. TaxID=1872133 RepID=UPI0040379985
MIKIFLNYRTSDAPYGAAMLDQALSDHFGSAAVFRASKSIPPGDRWEQAMMAAVRESSVLLAIMGKGWLDAADDNGRRKLDDPDDFVRREIRTAFEYGVQVVPVRLDTARVPAGALPADIAELATCQDICVHYRRSDVDIAHLVAKLREKIPGLRAAQRAKTEQTPARYAVHAQTVHKSIQADQINVSGDFIA